MPNDLQIALLNYSHARQHLLNAVADTESEEWRQAIRTLLDLPNKE